MKKILTLIAIFICIQSMGQRPWKPAGQVTQIPPGQVTNQQERMKEAVKSQAENFVIGNKRMWESKDNLIVEKNIPGSAFPDPANPLLPGVK